MNLPNVFNNGDKQSSFVEIEIPYISFKEEFVKDYQYETRVLSNNQKQLIDVLNERAINCYADLVSNVNDIIFNDGFHMEFRRKDGSVGQFNLPSYAAMKDAIKKLEMQIYEEFSCIEYDQMVKALAFTQMRKDEFNNFKELFEFCLMKAEHCSE